MIFVHFISVSAQFEAYGSDTCFKNDSSNSGYVEMKFAATLWWVVNEPSRLTRYDIFRCDIDKTKLSLQIISQIKYLLPLSIFKVTPLNLPLLEEKIDT